MTTQLRMHWSQKLVFLFIGACWFCVLTFGTYNRFPGLKIDHAANTKIMRYVPTVFVSPLEANAVADDDGTFFIPDIDITFSGVGSVSWEVRSCNSILRRLDYVEKTNTVRARTSCWKTGMPKRYTVAVRPGVDAVKN